jgi:hypothetical protein
LKETYIFLFSPLSKPFVLRNRSVVSSPLTQIDPRVFSVPSHLQGCHCH